MTNIKCIIVDDEPPAIQLLENYCSLIEHTEVVATCQSAIKAFDLFNTVNVDLLFLDIQMPVLTGIDFLKSLKNPPAVIFTTAYREYAIDGYDLDIVDYLLKPISFDRFLKSVDRYRKKFSSVQSPVLKGESMEYIFFNINKKHHKILIDDIYYIESLKDYVRIHTSGEKLVVKGNLGSILKNLPSARFTRIHRSYAIAMKALKTYSQRNVEINDISLPIGESYKEALLKRIKEKD